MVGEPVAQHARDDGVRAAGREADHELDRMVGVFALRERRYERDAGKSKQRDAESNDAHGIPPVFDLADCGFGEFNFALAALESPFSWRVSVSLAQSRSPDKSAAATVDRKAPAARDMEQDQPADNGKVLGEMALLRAPCGRLRDLP